MRWRRRVILLAVLLASLASVPLLWQVYWRVPGNIDFVLHRAEYENIVRTIKTTKFDVHLQTMDAEEISREQHIDGYRVWGKRSETGQYTITILTADWGHFGYGGYVYADTPPAPVKNQTYRTIDAPGDLPFVNRRLNTHWWTVYNNLY